MGNFARTRVALHVYAEAMSTSSFRSALTTDLGLAADTLTDGFRDDPVITWIFEDLDEPDEAMRRWWGLHVDPAPVGSLILVDADHRCAAVWHEPHTGDETRGDGHGLAKLLVGEIGEKRAHEKLGALATVGEAHPHEPPHWYLAAVATRRQHQGTGCAPLVIDPVLARCDADGLPAYLESSNPRNVGFYERLGFVVTGEIQVPGGPVLIPMWREPS